MAGPGDPDWGRAGEDPAKRARRVARQKKISEQIAAHRRKPPADSTDVVAMASHRAQLKKDAGIKPKPAERDNPTAMARKMLEQRLGQNEEMAAWQNVFNDRRRR